MNKTIAVTGGSGFLGNVVIKKLIAQGYNIRALIFNNDEVLDGLDIERIQGDIIELDSLYRLCESCIAVFHIASYISIVSNDDKKLKEVNIEGTNNIIAVCKKKHIRLVYVSSVEAIGKKGDYIHTEDDGFNPEHSLIRYGWSKAIATQTIFDTADLDAVVLCPSGIVGPYDYGTSKIGVMIKQFIYKKLPAYPSQGGFCFVDVRDVADAVIAAYTHADSGAYYIVSGEYCSISHLMNIIEDVSGVKKPRFSIPFWLMSVMASIIEPLSKLLHFDPIFTIGSVNILRSELKVKSKNIEHDLGIHTRPLKKTIEDNIKWYRGEEVSL